MSGGPGEILAEAHELPEIDAVDVLRAPASDGVADAAADDSCDRGGGKQDDSGLEAAPVVNAHDRDEARERGRAA